MKYVHLSLSLCTVLFRTHSLHCIVDSGLRNLIGLLPTVCRDTRVLSRALTALGSLQLGSRACVRVSKDLWYLRSLPPFYYYFFDCAHGRTNIKSANCRKHFPRISRVYINFKNYFLWSFQSIREKLTHVMEISIDMNRECTHFTHSNNNNNYYITVYLAPPPLSARTFTIGLSGSRGTR